MRILICLSACLFILTGNAQTRSGSVSPRQMYLAAYRHIAKDRANKADTIFVMDSLIDNGADSFIESLNRYPNQKKIALAYQKKDRERFRSNRRDHTTTPLYDTGISVTFGTIYSPDLASLFQDKKDNRANKILLFSHLLDNMLYAELVDRQENRTLRPLQSLFFDDFDNMLSDSIRPQLEARPYYEPIGSIYQMLSFTEATAYLFLFDGQGKIIKIFKETVCYD